LNQKKAANHVSREGFPDLTRLVEAVLVKRKQNVQAAPPKDEKGQLDIERGEDDIDERMKLNSSQSRRLINPSNPKNQSLQR
jgi:hypothetical protein